MTEKEKRDCGEHYYSFDKVLEEERQMAAEILHEIEGLSPKQVEDKLALFRQLLGTVGEKCYIERFFHCDYGYNIHLGENFYANVGCTILDCAEVHIGDNVLFAPYVGLYTAGHAANSDERAKGLEYAYPIHIGNNVWLGGNVVVLPGVTIGDNSIIGAGSVVNRDIPSNVLAVGNPCKVVKELK